MTIARRWAVLATILAALPALAQQPDSPSLQEQAQQFLRDTSEFRRPNLRAKWVGPRTLAYREGEQWVVWDIASGQESRQADEPPSPTVERSPNDRRRQPGRARQFEEAFSADGRVNAFYRDGNVFLKVGDETPRQLTTEGDPAKRLVFGTATWVYGEELGQREGLGVSPDGAFVWYYRMDERPTPLNMVVRDAEGFNPRFEPQAYPRAGQPNPVPDLFVYDVAAGKATMVEARPGDFDDGPGHLVYDPQFSRDSRELFFRRADRRQKVMEVCAADPRTGEVRVVLREERPQTFTEPKIDPVWLDDDEEIGSRPDLRGFWLWSSDRDGFMNLYLVDSASGATTPVTQNAFEVLRVVHVDLDESLVYYEAASEQNPYLNQLWVVNLDGTGNRRLTDPALNHRATPSPDGDAILDLAESLDTPPSLRVLDGEGKVLRVLATADPGPQKAKGITPVERFTYLAADGRTQLYGRIAKPRDFDPSRKYPVLVSVYGGPLDPRAQAHSESFAMPDRSAGYGFVVVELTNRGTGGRGKAFRDVTYGRLGQPDIDDIAAGVRELLKQPWADATRVAIEGTSYGGYASLLSILRYPELYQAAAVQSCVSDWRHYDSVYTERYMDLPQDNQHGYLAGSALTYINNLRGRLLLYYGTADDNTLPANTLSVVNAIGNDVELVVGVNAGHSSLRYGRLITFLLRALKIQS